MLPERRKDPSTETQPVISLTAEHVTPARTQQSVVRWSANQLPMRAIRSLEQRWPLTPVQTMWEGVLLLALTSGAIAAVCYTSPVFMFGLTLIVRSLFYPFYWVKVETGRYEARIATRSLAYINAVSFVAITAQLIQSQAPWRLWAYLFLVVALTMEIFAVRGWYTRWVEHDQRLNDRYGGMARVLEPKSGSMLGAAAWLIVEYIVYGILWVPFIDEALRFMFHIAT